MNTETGKIVPLKVFDDMPPAEQARHVRVRRDLTAKEKYDAQIKLYSPCACGSGKKFKFCCWTKKKKKGSV